MGTNTFKLTMAERQNGTFRVMGVEQRGVRMGSCSYHYGLISLPSMERAVQAITEFTRIAEQHNAPIKGAFATAIFRDAQNAGLVLKVLRQKTGVCPVVVSAKQEAILIQRGVYCALRDRAPKNMLIMDMGGGSLEFIKVVDNQVKWLRSFPLGAFRIINENGLSDPVTEQDIHRVNQMLMEKLKPLFRKIGKEQMALTGCSGAFESFVTMMDGYEDRLKDSLPAIAIERNHLEKLFQRILNADAEQRKQMKGLPAFRVDTIVPAALVTQFIINKFNPEIIYSSFYSMAEGAICDCIREKMK